VLRVAPNGAQFLVSPVALNSPTAVAVDAAGTVFIADTNNQRVLEVPGDGAPPTAIGTGLNHLQGVAVDAAGNVFIADSSNNRVVEVQRSRPPALTFSLTLVGKTNGPQPVTIRNIGNQRLTPAAPGLSIGSDFQQSPGGAAPIDCNPGLALRPGANCNLSISFVPQAAGNIQSSVILTNDAMNATIATQTISLSGTSMFPTTTSVQAASGVYSDPVTLSAVIGPAGLTFAGSLEFKVGGAPACSVAVTGSGTYSCTYAITQMTGSINATLTSADSTVQGSAGFNTLTVAREDATIVPSSLNPASVKVSTTGKTAPFDLRATLRQPVDGSPGNLSNALITVKLMTGPTDTGIACPAGVTSAGQVSAICRNIPVGTYTVQWKTAGSSYYQAPDVTTALTVTN
jgi:NHL repeat